MPDQPSGGQVDFFQPPRVTGDPRIDQTALIEWIWGFYNSAVVNGGFVQSADALTTEQVGDIVSELLTAGTGIQFVYDDDAGTLTANVTITQYTDAMALAAIGETTAAGVYTPTLTGVANVGASTAYQCQWMRVGDVVTVSGKVDVDPTAGGSLQLGISLPLPSNFAAEEDCGGVAFSPAVAGQGAAIRGDAANNRAELVYIAVDTANRAFYFSFSYRIL